MAHVATSTSGTELRTLIKQPETVVGAVMLCILAITVSQTMQQAGNLLNSNRTQNQQSSINIVLPNPVESLNLSASTSAGIGTTPYASSSALITALEQTATTSTSSTPTATISATPQPSPKVGATPSPSPIIAVSNQDGNVVVARINDTFWDIAYRTCGQGIQGYRIKEENGYATKHLHPGDQIVVTCN